MSGRFKYPGTPAGPITPMVYVKDKTVWQYKALTQFVEGGGAERGTGSSAEG